jgi:hypothetical protein
MLARKAKMPGGARTTVTELNVAVQMWPTPTSADQNSSGSANYAKSATHNPGTTLTDAAVRQPMWATPMARDYKGSSAATVHHWASKPGTPPLDYQAEQSFRQGLAATGEQSQNTTRRRLNPMFACWLMGWPTWWTHPEPINCAASEMASWRSKLRSLLDYYCGESTVARK